MRAQIKFYLTVYYRLQCFCAGRYAKRIAKKKLNSDFESTFLRFVNEKRKKALRTIVQNGSTVSLV